MRPDVVQALLDDAIYRDLTEGRDGGLARHVERGLDPRFLSEALRHLIKGADQTELV